VGTEREQSQKILTPDNCTTQQFPSVPRPLELLEQFVHE